MTRKHIFPAGKYFVGDLCYSVSDKGWDDLIEQTGCFGLDLNVSVPLDNFDDGLFSYRGMNCFISSTKYGDGSYQDYYGREYFVDSGNLGVMPIEVCDGNSMHGGHVLSFKNEFKVWEDDGNLYFDDNRIFTGDEDEDDDDWNDYDEDDE